MARPLLKEHVHQKVGRTNGSFLPKLSFLPSGRRGLFCKSPSKMAYAARRYAIQASERLSFVGWQQAKRSAGGGKCGCAGTSHLATDKCRARSKL